MLQHHKHYARGPQTGLKTDLVALAGTCTHEGMHVLSWMQDADIYAVEYKCMMSSESLRDFTIAQDSYPFVGQLPGPEMKSLDVVHHRMDSGLDLQVHARLPYD